MTKYFNEALKKTLGHEGGFSNDPADSGGRTNYGITQSLARRYGYTGDMPDLTAAEAEPIYYDAFWKPLRLDEIAQASQSVALELFDTAVNVGGGRATQWLQTALNALNNRGQYWPDLKVDGSLGKASLLALSSCVKKNRENVLLKALNCQQGNFYIQLTIQREKDERFLAGWLNKRVNL